MSNPPITDPLTDPNASIVKPLKRRGAPNGNKNALRHGFYAKNLGLSSPSKLDEFEMRNLMGEAAMPRFMRPRAGSARGVKRLHVHTLHLQP